MTHSAADDNGQQYGTSKYRICTKFLRARELNFPFPLSKFASMFAIQLDSSSTNLKTSPFACATALVGLIQMTS